ncbi:MAG: zinc ribbon domain-containing protein, partial [Myxococcota bacterium]
QYRNAFGASVALWWVGNSALDVAPYAYDARVQKLMLLGGVTGNDVPGYHDWNNLLRWTGYLDQAHTIGLAFWWAGVLIMGIALGWGLLLLIQQVRHLQTEPNLF